MEEHINVLSYYGRNGNFEIDLQTTICAQVFCHEKVNFRTFDFFISVQIWQYVRLIEDKLSFD